MHFILKLQKSLYPAFNAQCSECTVEKPNSVIVYGYNKYLLEESTRQIGLTSAISSYIFIFKTIAFPTGLLDREQFVLFYLCLFLM